MGTGHRYEDAVTASVGALALFLLLLVLIKLVFNWCSNKRRQRHRDRQLSFVSIAVAAEFSRPPGAPPTYEESVLAGMHNLTKPPAPLEVVTQNPPQPLEVVPQNSPAPAETTT